MTFVKINNTLYRAAISGDLVDTSWSNRSSKSITLEMTHATASSLFVNNVQWSIIDRVQNPVLEDGSISPDPIDVEYDNSEYSLSGDITDHRDGTITVKMGKLTDLEEAYALILG